MGDIIELARNLKNYEEVRDFLYGLRYHGAKYGLERMEHFAGILGSPQVALPCIHVAGTNGKGSTCAILEQILRDQGLKTGFYSSPHLIRQGERIQVNREILSEDEIVQLTKQMVDELLNTPDLLLDHWPSFFEFMTAMGFLKFANSKVDVAVIETGLGGRLDATNIIKPKLSIITSISLDHTQILGDTLEEIAFEKAGIIKPTIPVVLGRIPPEAEAVIRARAEELGSSIYSVSDRWGEDINQYPQTNLAGEFQRINSATAMLACEVITKKNLLGRELDLVKTSESLACVYWPGRWEVVKLPTKNSGECELILDATHNVEGARMLEQNLLNLFKSSGEKPVIVVGSLGEDRAKSLMETVCNYAEKLYLLKPSQPRALNYEQLRACIPESFRGEVIDSTVEELFDLKRTSICLDEKQSIVVTGSIYLIGEVSDRLKSTPVVDQQSLQDVV